MTETLTNEELLNRLRSKNLRVTEEPQIVVYGDVEICGKEADIRGVPLRNIIFEGNVTISDFGHHPMAIALESCIIKKELRIKMCAISTITLRGTRAERITFQEQVAFENVVLHEVATKRLDLSGLLVTDLLSIFNSRFENVELLSREDGKVTRLKVNGCCHTDDPVIATHMRYAGVPTFLTQATAKKLSGI